MVSMVSLCFVLILELLLSADLGDPSLKKGLRLGDWHLIGGPGQFLAFNIYSTINLANVRTQCIVVIVCTVSAAVTFVAAILINVGRQYIVDIAGRIRTAATGLLIFYLAGLSVESAALKSDVSNVKELQGALIAASSFAEAALESGGSELSSIFFFFFFFFFTAGYFFLPGSCSGGGLTF
jgi:hypothetical protein